MRMRNTFFEPTAIRKAVMTKVNQFSNTQGTPLAVVTTFRLEVRVKRAWLRRPSESMWQTWVACKNSKRLARCQSCPPSSPTPKLSLLPKRSPTTLRILGETKSKHFRRRPTSCNKLISHKEIGDVVWGSLSTIQRLKKWKGKGSTNNMTISLVTFLTPPRSPYCKSDRANGLRKSPLEDWLKSDMALISLGKNKMRKRRGATD